MKTTHKIGAARVIYHAVHGFLTSSSGAQVADNGDLIGRKMVQKGQGMETVVTAIDRDYRSHHDKGAGKTIAASIRI